MLAAGPASSSFATTDWLILAAYMGAVVAIGVACRRKSASSDEYFLAGRGMPMWAVSLSVVATALSAATFIGGPQQSYATDLTYFTANVGALLAVIIVAVVFVPAYYRHRVTSVYELLGDRYGLPAQRVASGMFMLGRLFASGARLFMVALPFSLIVFGDLDPRSLDICVIVIAVTACAYTMLGGIRAVIWTDVLQAVVITITVGIAVMLLLQRIPIGLDVMREALASESPSKLTLIDTSTDPSRAYTIWSIVIGFTLFYVAAFGTDQDLAQRMLTCRSRRAGSWSVVVANLINLPIVGLFLILGLLLYVYYQRPDLMGDAAPAYAIDDSRKVFLTFILEEMPTGVRGLMIAGLFAAAMSSMDSVLNALASTTVTDFLSPRRRAGEAPPPPRRAPRLAVMAWAIALAVMAMACLRWQQASGATLIDFALSVMAYAYAGLLGVFTAAILTRRGNGISAIAALITGIVAVTLMQNSIWSWWAPRVGLDLTLAFPWKLAIASGLSFLVCIAGVSRSATPPPHPPQ